MLTQLISFSIFTFLLAISPGPDNIFVLTQSIANGFKKSFIIILGLMFGCIIHTTLLAFGVSTLLAKNPFLLQVIKWAGALYLVYLAYKVYKSPTTINMLSKNKTPDNVSLFKVGLLMNLLNPKVLLFFLAVFPSFLWDNQNHTIIQFYILGFTFIIISLLIFTLIAFFASFLKEKLFNKKEIGVFFKYLQIVVFLGIAIYIVIFT